MPDIVARPIRCDFHHLRSLGNETNRILDGPQRIAL